MIMCDGELDGMRGGPLLFQHVQTVTSFDKMRCRRRDTHFACLMHSGLDPEGGGTLTLSGDEIGHGEVFAVLVVVDEAKEGSRHLLIEQGQVSFVQEACFCQHDGIEAVPPCRLPPVINGFARPRVCRM